jgi:hypothetical protein
MGMSVARLGVKNEGNKVETQRRLNMTEKCLSTSGLSPEERRKLWIEISDITAEEFDQLQAAHRARQMRVPRIDWAGIR